jgi:hypothetical protein
LGVAGLLTLNFAAGAASAQEQLPATSGAPSIPLVEFKADDRHHVLGTTTVLGSVTTTTDGYTVKEPTRTV